MSFMPYLRSVMSESVISLVYDSIYGRKKQASTEVKRENAINIFTSVGSAILISPPKAKRTGGPYSIIHIMG